MRNWRDFCESKARDWERQKLACPLLDDDPLNPNCLPRWRYDLRIAIDDFMAAWWRTRGGKPDA